MALLNQNELRQDLQLIEENIKKLEKQYMDFIDGVTSVEPKALRARTEALVRKWWGKPVANTRLRFQLQNIVQRYNAYKEKWDRLLRIKIKAEKEEMF
ncbi:hypothetical protein GF339_22090 [candidate division KSB3 bacterium]|uniref:Uncharacterized protein n=1 Tax=candidate division KSB3 bacterium TaxID=2044937 RepID=A0A9D5JZV9_9BACT|nr:hypothetical protein [candidate division KSB3 bacterium]MBD3327293.1 hypothetical protein [candidate division KSB3 bacterium]